MQINPPSYIPFNSLSKIDIIKNWDADHPYENLNEVSAETVQRLSLVSNRGILAYSIGCAHWVIYRYAHKIDISLLPEYIEACYPCLFGLSDRIPNELPQDEWVGSAKGPSQFAVFLIGDTWHSAEFIVPSKQGSYSEKLACYDIPDKNHVRVLFSEWRDVVLSRLQKHFPRIGKEPDGIGVPLGIIDSTIEFTGDNYEEQIVNVVRNISQNNTFLRDLSDFDLRRFN